MGPFSQSGHCFYSRPIQRFLYRVYTLYLKRWMIRCTYRTLTLTHYSAAAPPPHHSDEYRVTVTMPSAHEKAKNRTNVHRNCTSVVERRASGAKPKEGWRMVPRKSWISKSRKLLWRVTKSRFSCVSFGLGVSNFFSQSLGVSDLPFKQRFSGKSYRVERAE